MLVDIYISLLRELTLDLVDLQALRCELQSSIDDVHLRFHARFIARLQQGLQLSDWGRQLLVRPPCRVRFGWKRTLCFHECEADEEKGGRAALLPL
jgi:hypothetical protein